MFMVGNRVEDGVATVVFPVERITPCYKSKEKDTVKINSIFFFTYDHILLQCSHLYFVPILEEAAPQKAIDILLSSHFANLTL